MVYERLVALSPMLRGYRLGYLVMAETDRHLPVSDMPLRTTMSEMSPWRECQGLGRHCSPIRTAAVSFWQWWAALRDSAMVHSREKGWLPSRGIAGQHHAA